MSGDAGHRLGGRDPDAVDDHRGAGLPSRGGGSTGEARGRPTPFRAGGCVMAAEAKPEVRTAIELPSTVEVPTEALLDAIAALHALYDFHFHLAGIKEGLDGQLDSAVGDWCGNHSSALLQAAFVEPEVAPGEDEDDLFNRWKPDRERRYEERIRATRTIDPTALREDEAQIKADDAG